MCICDQHRQKLRAPEKLGRSKCRSTCTSSPTRLSHGRRSSRSQKIEFENVGRALCEAAGGKLIGAWLCFGEYDAVLIADMPDAESWSAVALAVTAGGAIGSGKTTVLMSGSQGVEALKKAEKVAKGYKPAK